MDTTLKIKCASSNIAVMFGEVFKCPSFKDHEIKSKVLLSECPLYYQVTAHLIVYSLAEIQWTSTRGKTWILEDCFVAQKFSVYVLNRKLEAFKIIL